MRSSDRSSSRAIWSTAAAVLMATGIAGCSSDASRFGESTFSSPPPPPQAAPTGRVESQPLSSNVEQPLPSPAPAPGPSYQLSEAAHSGHGEGVGHWTGDGGTEVLVAPGETVAVLSKRYGVPADSIIEVNHLSSPGSIRSGERLVIPRYQYASRPNRYALPRSRVHPTHAVATSRSSASGIHVVVAGETLGSIAHRYRKSRVLIAKANNIAADSKLKIGQQLKIPGSMPAQGTGTKAASSQPPGREKKSEKISSSQPQPSQRVATAEAGPVTAEVSAPAEPVAVATPAAPESTGSAPGFRWPVRGRIITPFGVELNGQHNDGINLAVPEGTSIKAAEDGVVAYAGNELKGYGNLVLVRHDNGFVTAYAHASEILVKRGDQVKRGQIIARAGQTGSVSSAQLHFEIRKGATPVDPTHYLSGT